MSGWRTDSSGRAGDINGLAKRIEEFVHKPLTDEERKIQLRGIAEKYNWQRIADRTLEVY